MASKKDMRREDLIVSFVEPEKDKNASSTAGNTLETVPLAPLTTKDDIATLAQSMPMAAMFMRNRMIGWTAVVFSVQNWLAESPDQGKDATPAYVSVGMSVLSLVVTYLPLFLPPNAGTPASNTAAQAPTPPTH